MGTYLNPGKAAFEEAVNSEIWAEPFKAYELSRELLRATWDGDAEKVMGVLGEACAL